MTTVGHSRCEILNVIPAKVFIEVRLDERVACPRTMRSSPPRRRPRSSSAASSADDLIVESLCDKYLEHMPIERQCTRFARYGVDIAPATLGRSVSAAIDLLAPVARLIEMQTRGPGLLATDATGIPVLDPAARDGIRSGHDLVLDQRALGELRVLHKRRRAERASLSRRGLRAHRAVRRHQHHDVHRACRRQAARLLGTRQEAPRRCRALRRPDRARRPSNHQPALRCGARLDARRRQRRSATSTTSAACAARSRRASRLGRRPARRHPSKDPARRRARVSPSPVASPRSPSRRRQHRGNEQSTRARAAAIGTRKTQLAIHLAGSRRRADRPYPLDRRDVHCPRRHPRAYLHIVTKLIVQGWPSSRLRELLPDRMLASHPEIYVGEPSALPERAAVPSLVA